DVQSEARRHLEVVGHEKIGGPAQATDGHLREGARAGGRDAEQGVGGRMAGITVRESHVAEERDGRLFVLESHPAAGEPGFERMASAVPVQVLLPLLREVQKARMSPLRLGDACDAQSLELHVEQAVNVGKTVGQPRYPEKLNDLLAEERTVSGIIVPGETP